MAAWRAPWENSRDVEDGAVRAGFSEFGALSAADNQRPRHLQVSFQAKIICAGMPVRATGAPPCNDKFARHWRALKQ